MTRTAYQTEYMGNASNDVQLNDRLPLATIPRTYALHPEKRELIVNYQKPVETVDTDQLKAALVYNATANFALIRNLKSITFHFSDGSYHATRNEVQAWYGVHVTALTNESEWNNLVTDRLTDKDYVNAAFHSFFG